ncbi:hypothetical protein [uncultured Ruminococcus sp.]
MQYAGFRRPDLQRGQTLRQLRLAAEQSHGRNYRPCTHLR